MSHEVLVAAAGIVPFSKKSEQSADLLAATAIRDLFGSGVDPALVDEAYFGSAKGGGLIGQRSLRFTGLASGLPVFNVENACASGGVAFHLAHRAIAAGDISCALVVGVDRLSVLGKGTLPVQETEWDGRSGMTNPVVYAMRARRYMHETGATAADLASVTVKSRHFAAMNPVAHMRTPLTVEEVLASRPIADPITLYQCSPKSDGAAAVLLVSEERARRAGLDGPRVRASVVTSGMFSMAERDITRPDITQRASSAAYEKAGVGPEDLDVVELHDAFTLAELLYTEELGLCADGEGVDHLRSGASASLEASGNAVVNPSGGLMGRGHPIGATGVAQIVECVGQLRGRAGARQRSAARTAMAHVTGGGASGFDNGACSVTILTN
ncbi:MAG: thiolase family protein [Acidimicrobiia bacterium]